MQFDRASIYVASVTLDKNMVQVLAEKSIIEIIVYVWPPISIMLTLDGLEQALCAQYIHENEALVDDDDSNDETFATDPWRENSLVWTIFSIFTIVIVTLLFWLIITKIEALRALTALTYLDCPSRAAKMSAASAAVMCTSSTALLCGQRDKDTVPFIFAGTGANLPIDTSTRWSIRLGCDAEDEGKGTCIIPDEHLDFDCIIPTSITPETFSFTLPLTRGAHWTNAIAKALDHNPRQLNLRDCSYETPIFRVWRYDNQSSCQAAIQSRGDEDENLLSWLLPLNYTSKHSYPIGGGKGAAAKEEGEATAKRGPGELRNRTLLAASGSTPSDTLYFRCLIDTLPCCARFNWLLECGGGGQSTFSKRMVARANCSATCASATEVDIGGEVHPYMPCQRDDCLVA